MSPLPFACQIPSESLSESIIMASNFHALTCDLCKESFSTKPLLKAHEDAVHRSSALTTKGKKKWACHLCSTVATQKSFIKQHLEDKHHVNSGFQCNLCPQRFGLVEQLVSHRLSTHTTGANRVGKFQELQSALNRCLTIYSINLTEEGHAPRSVEQLQNTPELINEIYNLLREVVLSEDRGPRISFAVVVRGVFYMDQGDGMDANEEMVSVMRSRFYEINPNTLQYLEHYVERAFDEILERATTLENCGSNWSIHQLIELLCEVIPLNETCKF